MHWEVILPEKSKKVSFNRKKRMDEMSFWINSTFSYLIVFISVSFIYLIWSLNVWATQWYEIIKLEKEKQDLLLKKGQLDTKIFKLESSDTIKNSESKKQMEKVENPDFIVIKNWINYVYNK